MSEKKNYKIRNWKDYNKALVDRGSITVWFDEESISAWNNQERSGKRGRPKDYSDAAILCCLTIKAVFHLPLRATEGLINSLLQLMKLELKAPDYTSLSVRQKNLKLPKVGKISSNEFIHLVVDSTGLKVYGEGEWKVRMHGKTKRRTWRKLHLGVNESSGTIEACVLTGNDVHDSEVLRDVVKQVDGKISQITGDGAYDTHDSYQVAIDAEAKPCFPPRCNAKRHKATDEAWRLRNHAVSQVHYKGLKDWKKKNNYHRRSLSETMMFRFKRLLGSGMSARDFVRQVAEAGIKCQIINKMTQLGMPITVAV